MYRLITAILLVGLALDPLAVTASEGVGGVHQENDHMMRMSEMMSRIRATEDADERMALMEQHMDEMHAAMAEMHRNLGHMMEQLQEERKEMKRLHDHRRHKNL